MAILSWQLRSTIQVYCFELVIYDGNRCLECLTFPNINCKDILVEDLHSSMANITMAATLDSEINVALGLLIV